MTVETGFFTATARFHRIVFFYNPLPLWSVTSNRLLNKNLTCGVFQRKATHKSRNMAL